MSPATDTFERRTATDVVFDAMHRDIVSLNLLPGTKLSEVEVARRFGVSRQPVRDAFARLASLDLLLIRPQKATEVRGFSIERIEHARFVRLSVELEVIRRACPLWDASRAEVLDESMDSQRKALNAGDTAGFHALDFAFHKNICVLAGYPLAAKTIEDSKHKVDRLCVLSLGKEREVETLLDDHRRLAFALQQNDPTAAVTIATQHFGRLDDTISDIYSRNSEFFEDGFDSTPALLVSGGGPKRPGPG